MKTLRSWRTSLLFIIIHKMFPFSPLLFVYRPGPCSFFPIFIFLKNFLVFLISGFHAKPFLTTTSLIPFNEISESAPHNSTDDFIMQHLAISLFVKNATLLWRLLNTIQHSCTCNIFSVYKKRKSRALRVLFSPDILNIVRTAITKKMAGG